MNGHITHNSYGLYLLSQGWEILEENRYELGAQLLLIVIALRAA